MFKASTAPIHSLMSRLGAKKRYAGGRELRKIHDGQVAKNRFLERAKPAEFERARAVKLPVLLSAVLSGGHNNIAVAATLNGRYQELFNDGCVSDRTDYIHYHLGKYVASQHPAFNGTTWKSWIEAESLAPQIIDRIKMQYDFSHAQSSFDALINSAKYKNALKNAEAQAAASGGSEKENVNFHEEANSMILTWLGEVQQEMGSEWLVIVDDEAMMRLRPELMLGATVLSTQSIPYIGR